MLVKTVLLCASQWLHHSPTHCGGRRRRVGIRLAAWRKRCLWPSAVRAALVPCAECIRVADDVPGRAADYNRLKAAEPSLNARVLVLTASPGVGQQYVATMNCIFSAQKIGVAIDTCVCADVQSKFLQQAAHITGGVYFEVPTKLHSGLLQFLLTYYLPDPAARPYLRQPPQVSWVAVRHALCG